MTKLTPATKGTTTKVALCALSALLLSVTMLACGPDGAVYVGLDDGETGELICDTPADARRSFAEIECSASGCHGRWECSDLWSRIIDYSEVNDNPTVETSAVWPCDKSPDVDVCVVIDTQGRVGCYRFEYGFAVAVAPACQNLDPDMWIEVGNGMVSKLAD